MQKHREIIFENTKISIEKFNQKEFIEIYFTSSNFKAKIHFS